jgi:hypothetical protein
VSQNYGSPALANESLRNAQGQAPDEFSDTGEGGADVKSLEDWTRKKEIESLVGYQLQRQIYNRVNISWREILLAYEKEHEKFNPDPAAIFRMIAVSSSKTDTIAKVQETLASGGSFDDLASSDLNEYEPKKGGLRPKISFKDEYEKFAFFNVAPLNDAAHSLVPGEWAGPVQVSRTTYWIKLEAVDRFSMDVYHAQLEIERSLKLAHAQEGREHYIQRLRAHASFTDVDEMTARLLDIATERYYPVEKAKANAPIEPPRR